MLLELVGALGMVGCILGALAILAAFLSQCSYSISFHLEHTAEKPLALPDYSRATWYPVAIESPYKTVVTASLPHCEHCKHPFEEEDITYFCGYCGHPSGELQ